VLESLKELLNKQQQLQELFLTPNIDNSKNDGEGYQMDVELF